MTTIAHDRNRGNAAAARHPNRTDAPNRSVLPHATRLNAGLAIHLVAGFFLPNGVEFDLTVLPHAAGLPRLKRRTLV